jgi:outer membrane protein TolC
MKKILILFLVLINTFFIFTQEEEKKVLTFSEYMEIIQEKVPELKQSEIDLKLAENNLFKANSLHDVLLKGSFVGIGEKTYPDGSTTEIWYSSGFKGEGSISTTLPSGTELSAGTEYTQMYSTGYRTDRNSVGEEIETEFFTTTRDPIIKFGIKQPLLYNWFGFLDRYAKKNARMQVAIEKLMKEQRDNEILNYYKKLYFLWYQWGQILDFLQTTITNAKRLETQTGQKLRSGIAENDEFQRARYSVFKYEEQYKQNEMEYKRLLNELSVFFDAESMVPEITKLDEYPFYVQAIDADINYVEFEETITCETLNLNKEQIELLRKNKFNQVLPQLNLLGTLDVKFHEFYYDQEGHNLADNKYDYYAGDIDFTAGIELVFPLINFKARGDLREAKLMLEDIVLEFDKTKNNYNRDLNNTITNITILKEIIAKKNQNLESLNSRIRTERIKYAQARQIELGNLIETENLITSEEVELMKAKANIITLYLDYLRLIL